MPGNSFGVCVYQFVWVHVTDKNCANCISNLSSGCVSMCYHPNPNYSCHIMWSISRSLRRAFQRGLCSFLFFFPKLRRSLMTLTLDLFNFMLVIPVSAQSLGWGRGLQHPRVLQEQMPRCTLCQQGLAWRGCDLNPWHLKSWRNICFPYHTALRNYRKEKPTPERKLCVQFGVFFCAKACSGCSQTGNKCTVDFTDPFSWVSGSVTEVMLCWWPCRNWALSESRATLRSTVLTGEQ